MPDKSLTIAEAAAYIDRSNNSWVLDPDTTPNITFAFRATRPSYNDQIHNPRGTFTQSTAADIEAAVEVIKLWTDIADINLTRVGTGSSGRGAYSDNATILFGNYASATDGSGAFTGVVSAGATDPRNRAGDVWINTLMTAPNPTPGDASFFTLIHEIGHALGLAHPGKYDAGPGIKLTYANDAEFNEDSWQYTVMSYFSAGNTGANHQNIGARTPLVTDIHALQLLYGANTNTRTDDTIYGFNSNADRDAFKITKASEQVVFAIWDAGGIDTLDVSLYGSDQTIDLRPGEFSNIGRLQKNVAMAIAPPKAGQLDYFIENAIGGNGHDILIGNDRANQLDGGLRNDTITGGARIDTLIGGDGLDSLDGGNGDDVLEGDAGNDTLIGGADSDTAIYAGNMLDYDIVHQPDDRISIRHINGLDGLDQLISVEFGEFNNKRVKLENIGVLHGTSAGETLEGYWSQNDYLNGGGGNDSIYGDAQTLPGDENPTPANDTLNGDAGNDHLRDVIGGSDKMYGGDGADDILGGFDDKPDFLDGGDGDDDIAIIARRRGIADTVRGGAGNDSLALNSPQYESTFGRKLEGEAGNDRLFGGFGDDTLDGGAGNDYLEDSGYVSRGSNLFLGGDNNDTLIGSSVFGRDTFDGGAGNDLIINVSRLDIVRGGKGSADFMNVNRNTATVGFRLDLGRSLEVQILADGTSISGIEYMSFEGGSGNDILEGVSAAVNNKLPDTLIGNAGNDVLDGGGGADTMNGGSGNDTFYVNRFDDVVIERAGNGHDVIYTSVSFSLMGNHAESLIVLDPKGTQDFEFTGNELSNLIVANAGNNELTGKGGADTLKGGGGHDLYNIENGAQVVLEAEGRGNDRVILYDSTTTAPYRGYALAKGSEIETLIARTSTDMHLIGNEFDNELIGNSRHNSIEGGAGNDTILGLDGADTLYGGAGNDELDGGFGQDLLKDGPGKDTLAGGFDGDIYQISSSGSASDVIREFKGDIGTDVVVTSVSYTLPAWVENLHLQTESGTGAITGFGNGSVNAIFGNGQFGTIDGLGGADSLFGAEGPDRFQFSSTIGSGNIDTVRDFNPADDTIKLSAAIFTGLGGGPLNPGAFVIGEAAADANDRIIYISGNGGLYYDADGSNARSSPIQFALLDAGLSLTSADFIVY